MSYGPIAAFIVLAALAAIVIVLVRAKLRGRGLSAAEAARLRSAMKAAAAQQDQHRRVIESAKVLDAALKALGFGGSFADKLRAAQPRLKDPQSVWNALKLRNRLAHEVGADVSSRDASAAAAAFMRALEQLC